MTSVASSSSAAASNGEPVSSYPMPSGMHSIPLDQLDMRSDEEIDADLLSHKPVTSEKNIWFFWNTGFPTLHPYSKRTVRAWHRRLTPKGWTIRVTDLVPDSPLNVSKFIDTKDEAIVPKAFREGTIGGKYAPQHVSDLVRFPLLIQYGGVYTDVGLLQIGDMDRLWNETIGDPSSPYEVISYFALDGTRNLRNHFLCAGKGNPLFVRFHRLFLALWAADGGKTNTEGMHASPLLKGVANLGGNFEIVEDGKTINAEESGKLLSDYIIQGQAMTMVMGLIDEEDNWNGPEYSAKHIYLIEADHGSQMVNIMLGWNGRRAFELMSLPLPHSAKEESADQKEARGVVEACLQKSFGFKLAHGMIIRVFKETLGSLWRANEGSDNVPGTYAHWLRHGTIYWNQDELPPPVKLEIGEPIKRGPLLRQS